MVISASLCLVQHMCWFKGFPGTFQLISAFFAFTLQFCKKCNFSSLVSYWHTQQNANRFIHVTVIIWVRVKFSSSSWGSQRSFIFDRLIKTGNEWQFSPKCSDFMLENIHWFSGNQHKSPKVKIKHLKVILFW